MAKLAPTRDNTSHGRKGGFIIPGQMGTGMMGIKINGHLYNDYRTNGTRQMGIRETRAPEKWTSGKWTPCLCLSVYKALKLLLELAVQFRINVKSKFFCMLHPTFTKSYVLHTKRNSCNKSVTTAFFSNLEYYIYIIS